MSLVQTFSLVLVAAVATASMFPTASAKVHYHDFVVAPTSYTRLCETKDILTINGQFPGPTLFVNRGDIVVINSYNNASYGITIHWHGLMQPRNPWSDGTDSITMCKVEPGGNFTYTLLFSDEEGTIWYHAHSDWTRATVHGAIVVYPKRGAAYPFPKPDKEYIVILGEWWKSDVMKIMEEGMATGDDFTLSDANTINGQPGDLFPCSRNGTAQFAVEQNKTYLYRLVNAGLSTAFFFAIQNHTLTVVGRDGSYMKPFEREHVMIDLGQTMDVLMTANQERSLYYMAARAYNQAAGDPDIIDDTIPTAIVEYSGYDPSQTSLSLPFLPANNDTLSVYSFSTQLRSLASEDHPVDVPTDNIGTHLAITASMNHLPCPECTKYGGKRISSSMNNISFSNPSVDVLSAYYNAVENVYAVDFPSFPPNDFNYTGSSSSQDFAPTTVGTKVKVLNYNETVEILIQGTGLVLGGNHPIHLHGYKFYVVGRGFGNFDPERDPLKYNLVDPPEENTVSVPHLGWAVLRFRASNPGVWLMHCHMDRHYSWGMSAVFIVKNGPTNETSILAPPQNMPACSDELSRPFGPLGSEHGSEMQK